MTLDDDAVLIWTFALASVAVAVFSLLVGFYALALFSFFGFIVLYALAERVQQEATWGFA